MHESHVLLRSLSEEPGGRSGRPQRRNYGLATSSPRMSCLDKSHVVRQLTRSEKKREEEGGRRRRASHNPLMRSRHVPFERGEATTSDSPREEEWLYADTERTEEGEIVRLENTVRQRRIELLILRPRPPNPPTPAEFNEPRWRGSACARLAT